MKNKSEPYIIDAEADTTLVLKGWSKHKKLNTKKIKTLKDVKLIFEAMDLGFSDDNKKFEKIKHLLID